MTVVPLLHVNGLSVKMPSARGPVSVVEGVDLKVDAGESLGLVGESGCGKTTTLLAVLRLLPVGSAISAGQIIFEGEDLRLVDEPGLRAIRGGRIGVIWQDPLAALDPVMRVGEQIAEAVRAHTRLDRRHAQARAKELMRLVELPDVDRTYRAYPHELSGGQRQRIVIATAIAAEPVLLLADEPTTALDVTVQDQVLTLLSRLRVELGLALLLITHDLAIISQTCNRVGVMYAGRIVETGQVAEVFAAPRHPYTAGLIAAAPSVDRPGERPAGIAGTPPAAVASQNCAFAPRCPRSDQMCANACPTLGEETHAVACHHPLTTVGQGSARRKAARSG